MGKYRQIFAENLRREMEVHKIHKAELCKKAKIDRMSLDKYLEGKVSAGLDKIEAIARVFDVSVAHLLTDTDAPVEVHPEVALKQGAEYLKGLAKKFGYPWPPTIGFFAMLEERIRNLQKNESKL